MDRYWPMAEGPFTPLDFAKWRRMAAVFSKDGVVRGRGEGFVFHGWPEPNVISLGSGAAWVNGCYAEMGVDPHPHRHLWLSTPGDYGLVTLALDPFQRHVAAFYLPGEFQPHQAMDSWWHIPLWELHGYGEPVVDRRVWVPDEPPAPPVTVIPSWVPHRINSADTGAAWVGGDGGNPMVVYPGWGASYVAPRHWRFTAYMRGDNYNATSTNGWGYTGELWFFVRDASGERLRAKMGGPATGSTQAGVVRFEAVCFTGVVPNCWGELLAAFEQRIAASQAGGAWGYPAGCLRIECEEIGSDDARDYG